MTEFQEKLIGMLNATSQENDSNTPDFILAQYMMDALHAFNTATQARDSWYGMQPQPGMSTRTTAL